MRSVGLKWPERCTGGGGARKREGGGGGGKRCYWEMPFWDCKPVWLESERCETLDAERSGLERRGRRGAGVERRTCPPVSVPRGVAFRTGQPILSPSRPLALHLASPVVHSAARSPACVGGALAGTPLPEPLSRWLRGTAGAGRVLPPRASEPLEVGRILRVQLSNCSQHPPLGSCGLA